MVMSVANMSGMSNMLPRARLMSTPRPWSPPAHSATMAPTTASVAPMRSPPMIWGSAEGTSMCRRSCQRLARRLRPSSTRRGSTERMPTMVPTAMGK
jgi:hypothetical protein